MTYKHVGNCPRCGAPIYAMTQNEQKVSDSGHSADWSGEAAPAAYFTCECRKAKGWVLPDLDDDEIESTEAIDRKHLDKMREREEDAPSAERAE